MLPQSDYEGNIVGYLEPDLTYRVDETIINGKIDNLEAVKQSIYHILSTERYSNPIYGDNYGIELEQYIGKDYGMLCAGIEDTLNDALLQDERITGITLSSIEKSEDGDGAVIEFTVHTIYGDTEENLNVVQ